MNTDMNTETSSAKKIEQNTQVSSVKVTDEDMERMEQNMPHMIPISPDNRGYTDLWECPCCNKRVHLGSFTKNYEYDFCANCGQFVL